MSSKQKTNFIQEARQGAVVVHVPDAHTFEVPLLSYDLVVLSPDCEQYSCAGLGEGKRQLRHMLEKTLRPGEAGRAHLATLQLQSALRITNAVALHNPGVRILLEEVVMGSSELGDPWRELLELFAFGYTCNLNAADVGGHSRSRNFGSTHFVPPLVEAEDEEGTDWQDYLYCALATAPKAHAMTTVNANRNIKGDPAKDGAEGNASISTSEAEFDKRSPYYNLVYCLLHNRWRPMFRVEAETLMGWPPGYTRALEETAAKERIGKGIDVAVIMWVMMNWYTDIGPGVGGAALGPRRKRLALASAPDHEEEDLLRTISHAPSTTYEQQRQHNIQMCHNELNRLGLMKPTALAITE